MLNTTKPTIKYLEDLGYVAVDVEAKGRGYVKQDVLGFIDILALGEETIGVQATSIDNMGERRKKILGSSYITAWFCAGNYVWLFGWEERLGKLVHRLQKLTLEDVVEFQRSKLREKK